MEIPTEIKGIPQPDCIIKKVSGYPKISHFFLSAPRNLQTGLFFGGGGSSLWIRHAATTRYDSRVFSVEFVTRGSFRFEQDQEAGLASAGDVFLVRQHADHSMKCVSETAEKRMFKLDGPLLPILLRGLHLERANILHPHSPERIMRIFDRITQALVQKKTAFELSVMAVELLFTIAEDSAANALPQLAMKLSEYLEQHLHDKFSLEAMAHHFSMSKSTLLRRFAQYFHTTPGAYLKQIRLEMAQTLLLHENELHIKQIAEQVGYPSPLHFSAEFTAFSGVSPKVYRDNAGKFAGKISESTKTCLREKSSKR